jgi:hypothetical protein
LLQFGKHEGESDEGYHGDVIGERGISEYEHSQIGKPVFGLFFDAVDGVLEALLYVAEL